MWVHGMFIKIRSNPMFVLFLNSKDINLLDIDKKEHKRIKNKDKISDERERNKVGNIIIIYTYATYGYLTGKFLDSNSKKCILILAWP